MKTRYIGDHSKIVISIMRFRYLINYRLQCFRIVMTSLVLASFSGCSHISDQDISVVCNEDNLNLKLLETEPRNAKIIVETAIRPDSSFNPTGSTEKSYKSEDYWFQHEDANTLRHCEASFSKPIECSISLISDFQKIDDIWYETNSDLRLVVCGG